MPLISFIKPDKRKILLTFILAFLTGMALTKSLDGALSFFMLLTTPFYTEYADVKYTSFNYGVLLWFPLYLISCIVSNVINSLREKRLTRE